MKPTVKICGFMRAEDVQMCITYGVDIVGFVADYPLPVPWNLNIEETANLIKGVNGKVKTCVVTGIPPGGGSNISPDVEKVLRFALTTKPNYIQLHCDETLDEVTYLANELHKHGIKIIKTIYPHMPDLIHSANAYHAAGAYALLLDSRGPGNAASGGAADLDAFARLRSAVDCPLFLAGGITPENVACIIARSQAGYIDIMSGVETSPGIKDETKVAALFQALNS